MQRRLSRSDELVGRADEHRTRIPQSTSPIAFIRARARSIPIADVGGGNLRHRRLVAAEAIARPILRMIETAERGRYL